MRLWDFRLLPFLDDFHIVAQWRELLAIKGAIDKNGTPNHRLVNKVLDYNIKDFKNYTTLVAMELMARDIKYLYGKYEEILYWDSKCFNNNRECDCIPYHDWHNHRYITQCYYNLQEKADCGIVSKQAWARIDEFYKKEMGNNE
jgi:uncharacterized protein (TIGR02328 family)